MCLLLLIRKVCIFLYLVLSISFPFKAISQQRTNELSPVVLQDHQDSYVIGKHVQILEDTTGNRTIDEVRSSALSGRFRQSKEDSPNLGFTTSIHWLRFKLNNQRKNPEDLLLELDMAPVDKITLYLRDQRGQHIMKEAGNRVAFSSREIKNRNPVFVIPASHTDSILYLRIDPGAVNTIPVSLYTQQAFLEKEINLQLVFGLLYGVIIVISVLSLVLYILSKEQDFLLYFLYMVSLFLTLFWNMGYAFQYLWPDAASFNYRIPVLLYVLMTILLILFNKHFLRLQHYFPLLNKIFAYIAVLHVFIAFDGLFFDKDRAIFMGSTAFVFVLLMVTIVSFLCLQRGYKPAIYPFLAYLVVCVCYIITYLKYIAVLPHNNFTAYFIYVAYVLEAILFLVGVGYKLSISTKEKVLAQQKAFALQLERVELEKRQEVAQMKSELYDNISHEFRTPLTLILAPIQKILSEVREDHPHWRLYHIIERQAGRLLQLINQLLDVSKIEADKMQLNIQEVDIASFFHKTASSFIASAEIKKIDYLIHLPESSRWVYLDTDKTEKIINNLLSNAFKFTGEKGKIWAKLELIEPAKQSIHTQVIAQITVADTGIGIASDQIDLIFDRFYQVPDARMRDDQGTGIGLSLTKALIGLYKGTITVASEPGKGSTFTLKLPLDIVARLPDKENSSHVDTLQPRLEKAQNPELLVAPDEKLSENVAVASDTSLPIYSNGEYILLVEDHPQMRNFIKTTIREATSYQVLEADNGEEAYKLAAKVTPDLVITDSMMPVMNGIELCQKLKEDEKTSHIPVILLTARSSMESKVAGLQTGADDYIIKPFEASELLMRIKNLIDSRKKLREHFSREIILQPAALPITSADEKFLQKAMRIIEDNLDNPDFGVETFSQHMNISRMQLLRKLKALTNQSPVDFIRDMRLHRASELLANKAGTISEIAYQVGFNDPSYFAKLFHKKYGQTPSEFSAKAMDKK